MNVVALIIARGGSKRLPRKNVLSFAGRPLVEWAIIQARTTRCLKDEDIYLSTDDDEIAEIGSRNHIQVIRRPVWPDADRLSAMPVYMHAFGEICKTRPVTHTFTMLPTTVCRLPGDLDRVFDAYRWLKPMHPDCQEVVTLTPRRETELHEVDGVVTHIKVWDKLCSYFAGGPSAEIREIEWYDRWGAYIPHDGDDSRTETGREFIKRPMYYIVGQWYQGFDIDDADSFLHNEMVFKQFILQGHGEEIYWQYKAGGQYERVDRVQQTAPQRGAGGGRALRRD